MIAGCPVATLLVMHAFFVILSTNTKTTSRATLAVCFFFLFFAHFSSSFFSFSALALASASIFHWATTLFRRPAVGPRRLNEYECLVKLFLMVSFFPA
jgi:hypothetical protein